MLTRKIEKKLQSHFENQRAKALLITGARQVGKTYVIRKFIKEKFENSIELNFLEDKRAKALFEEAKSSQDIIFFLSTLTVQPLIPGKTIIFFDEVQECKELVTAIKFLVDQGDYQYVLSGSLLGVELKNIRSVPVGYMDILEMFPLDFEEFAIANGVKEELLSYLKKCFKERTLIFENVHEQMMDLFRLYLVVGGMPAAVQAYIHSNNLQHVINEQKSIINTYIQDIGKYDQERKLHLKEIYSLIPSELNSKNKRFYMKDIGANPRFSRYENSFVWLQEAGVALPVFNVSEPMLPLLLSKTSNLFKLFLSDVGLLAAMYMNDIQVKILKKEIDINYGSIYENMVAQELRAHGFELYYYNSKRQGELDFLIEYQQKILPIEVKSGKAYRRHNALLNVLGHINYSISEAIVFSNKNIYQENKIVYYPIYMIMFLENHRTMNSMEYKPDLDVLKNFNH